MFTLPHNTIAYLYKEAIDMRLGMFRLQGVIAEQLSQPMVRGSFFLFINKPHTLLIVAAIKDWCVIRTGGVTNWYLSFRQKYEVGGTKWKFREPCGSPFVINRKHLQAQPAWLYTSHFPPRTSYFCIFQFIAIRWLIRVPIIVLLIPE